MKHIISVTCALCAWPFYGPLPLLASEWCFDLHQKTLRPGYSNRLSAQIIARYRACCCNISARHTKDFPGQVQARAACCFWHMWLPYQRAPTSVLPCIRKLSCIRACVFLSCRRTAVYKSRALMARKMHVCRWTVSSMTSMTSRSPRPTAQQTSALSLSLTMPPATSSRCLIAYIHTSMHTHTHTTARTLTPATLSLIFTAFCLNV
jgi:hypothetical protein